MAFCFLYHGERQEVWGKERTCWKGYEPDCNLFSNVHLCPKGNPPLLPLISPSPTLSLSFIHFAGCTAKGFFATCKPSCFFRETNRKRIKRHICVCVYTPKVIVIFHCLAGSELHTHLLPVLAAWSELQCHGDCDGISLADSKQTVYCYHVSVFILVPTAAWT